MTFPDDFDYRLFNSRHLLNVQGIPTNSSDSALIRGSLFTHKGRSEGDFFCWGTTFITTHLPRSKGTITRYYDSHRLVSPRQVQGHFNTRASEHVGHTADFLPRRFFMVHVFVHRITVRAQVRFRINQTFRRFYHCPRRAGLLLQSTSRTFGERLSFHDVILTFPGRTAIWRTTLRIRFRVRVHSELFHRVGQFTVSRSASNGRIRNVSSFPRVFKMSILPPTRAHFIKVPSAHRMNPFVNVS